MQSEPMLTPWEKSPLPENILPRGGWNPRRCIKQDSEPNTLPTSYSQQFSQGFLWNSVIVCQIEHRSFPISDDETSAASFLHSSLFQVSNAVMLWPVHDDVDDYDDNDDDNDDDDYNYHNNSNNNLNINDDDDNNNSNNTSSSICNNNDHS